MTQTATQNHPMQDQPADAYEPTADDWASYSAYLDSLPALTPEDFGPTPERVEAILAECDGLPF